MNLTAIVLSLGLIAIPILFNWTFAALAKQFEYPDILRKPTIEVLQKFREGGSKLVSTWWLFAMSAVGFGLLAVIAPSYFEFESGMLSLTATLGLLAALTQFLGLVRWPFMVPHLAREAEDAAPEKLAAIDVVFQSFNRYLGVAVGEHLGYLFTGLWTAALGVGLLQNSALGSDTALGVFLVTGVVIGALLVLCSFEFVGKNELNGWNLAGRITPFVYIAWSLWLIVLGGILLVQALAS